MKKILLIGSEGLVGKSFYSKSFAKFSIDRIDKTNINELNSRLNNKYDCLIYLALSKDYKSRTFSKDIMKVNVEIFRDILEKAVDRIENVIFFSTGSVYKKSSEALVENSPVDYQSKNPYILSKIISEMITQSYEDYFNSIALIRPFYIYGKNQNRNMLFQNMKMKVLNKEQIVIGKNGGLIFNPIYVDDVVTFINQLVMKQTSGRHIYNFCGDEILSLKDLIHKIAELFNIEPLIEEQDRERDFVVGNKNNKFACSFSLKEGLEATFNGN